MARAMSGLLLLLLAPLSRAGADPLQSMAREVSREAKRVGMERVVVLALKPAHGAEPMIGADISERLAKHIARLRKLRVLDSRLAHANLSKVDWSYDGNLTAAGLRKMDMILSAQGVLTGSYRLHKDRVIVTVRLIDGPYRRHPLCPQPSLHGYPRGGLGLPGRLAAQGSRRHRRKSFRRPQLPQDGQACGRPATVDPGRKISLLGVPS